MYFNTQPKIEYDLKPQSFPFSSSDFTIANNFFRRVSVDQDAFGYIGYFNKFAIPNNVRIETLAEGIYGDAQYDWIIAISNNITNVYTDWPLSENALQVWAEEKYGSQIYSDIRYYEITEDVKNEAGTIFLKKGQKVDKTFYDGNFQYNSQDVNNTIITIAGNTISKGISIFEDETRINESKREIYILKSEYLYEFVQDLKKQSTYKKCSAYVNNKLKRTLV
tara:strand:- start:1057 stop:1722 length:666 start_codon:yes stop_codon:yes gene_type:complete